MALPGGNERGSTPDRDEDFFDALTEAPVNVPLDWPFACPFEDCTSTVSFANTPAWFGHCRQKHKADSERIHAHPFGGLCRDCRQPYSLIKSSKAVYGHKCPLMAACLRTLDLPGSHLALQDLQEVWVPVYLAL